MLGSHNSCTFLPCRKWWMYLINWAAKCQSKSLTGQFQQGARYFDIRVKYDSGKFILAHGLVEYKGDLEKDVLGVLNALAALTQEDIYVRFMLEYNKIPDEFATKIEALVRFVEEARGKYPRLTYHTVISKWNEYPLATWHSMDVHHAYSSILGWKRFLWIPYWYARFHNRKTRKDNKALLEGKDKVLLLDFVNV